MFGNEDVCKIVLFMSGSIDCELLKFSGGVFTFTMGCMRICLRKNSKKLVGMVFIPEKKK